MPQRTCSVPGCDKPHYGNGFCRRHNRLNTLYGDPLKSKYPPNRHVVIGDCGQVTVTRLDGEIVAGLYDLADAALVQRYTWHVGPRGYLSSTTGTRLKGPRISTVMHRLVLGVVDPNVVVDHINGDRLDNRRGNLRSGDSRSNNLNRAEMNRLGTSLYRGVSWDKARKRWAAHVGLDYKLHHLGRFATEAEAAAAVAAFRRDNGLPAGY